MYLLLKKATLLISLLFLTISLIECNNLSLSLYEMSFLGERNINEGIKTITTRRVQFMHVFHFKIYSEILRNAQNIKFMF